MKWGQIWQVLRSAIVGWQADRAPSLGAALAYYALFSLAPLLIIATAVAGVVFGEDAARGRIQLELSQMLGSQGAAAVGELVNHAAHDTHGKFLGTVLGAVALFFGAMGVFRQLKDALNTIWSVEPKPGHGIYFWATSFLLSLAMIFSIGLLLLVSLLFSTVLGAASEQVSQWVRIPETLFFVVDWSVSLGLTSLLFAVLFKTLPDAHIAWREVWIGALITAILFAIGKLLLGFYFGTAAIRSAYGAAGSLVIVLIWSYYSAQIVLFGAELTQSYACCCGGGIVPASYAQFVGADSRSARANNAKRAAQQRQGARGGRT